MWAVQAKLLVGLLGGLLLSSIRSNPCTHTHTCKYHILACMHAWALIDGFSSCSQFSYKTCSHPPVLT